MPKIKKAEDRRKQKSKINLIIITPSLQYSKTPCASHIEYHC
jgi:hypothetical protein